MVVVSVGLRVWVHRRLQLRQFQQRALGAALRPVGGGSGSGSGGNGVWSGLDTNMVRLLYTDRDFNSNGNFSFLLILTHVFLLLIFTVIFTLVLADF